MSKQTAVQILVESMTTSDVSFYSKEITIALQMEREQIIDARQDGVDAVFKGYSISNDEYYNKTYGGKE